MQFTFFCFKTMGKQKVYPTLHSFVWRKVWKKVRKKEKQKKRREVDFSFFHLKTMGHVNFCTPMCFMYSPACFSSKNVQGYSTAQNNDVNIAHCSLSTPPPTRPPHPPTPDPYLLLSDYITPTRLLCIVSAPPLRQQWDQLRLCDTRAGAPVDKI